MKDETGQGEPSTFWIPFKFQCEKGELDANITHILVNAYTQTMENRLLDSDWISIALYGKVNARYAWIKPLLPFSRLLIFGSSIWKIRTQFLSWARPHVGTEPKVEISQMNHPWGTVCCSKVIQCPYYPLPFPGTQRVGVSTDWCIKEAVKRTNVNQCRFNVKCEITRASGSWLKCLTSRSNWNL